MEGECVFAPVVTVDEWQTVPTDIAKKIHSFVNEKFEEFITSKALLETNRFNAEQTVKELTEQHENTKLDNEKLKGRLEAAAKSIEEYENQISIMTSEVSKLQVQSNKLEAETAEFRHQRNLAVDERDEHLKMIQRRNTEVERMQSEITTLTQQLEAAVNAKCEALAKSQEVDSMKITIEYKEKRMEQERSMMNEQIESLTEDLNQRTEELLNMRRDNTSRCIQLETKLTEKTQELIVATEQIKSLTDLNNNFATRHEELSQKLLSQREIESKMNESYTYEIEAKTKMANAYKSMYEESQQHAEELKTALAEVQDLLKNATEQYGELETKHKESELAHEEIIVKKNDCIAMLKKELETANELLESTKHDQIHRDMEGSSPAAASASRYMKSGMTMTEIYSQYVTVSDKLTNKDEECARLNNLIACIYKEIEEKGPLIKKLRQDYCTTLDANDELKQANDQLLNDLQQLREANAECRKLEGKTARENARLKKEVADLSRQVCHLLQEVEHSRIGSSSFSNDMDLGDSISSADIISKKLVTFNDISELQSQNQKLLACIRELTERQEEAESIDPIDISNLKTKLDNLRESQNELLEERDRQNKMMVTLRNQRDMYKNLYSQAVKASGEDIPMQLERTYGIQENGEISKTQTDSESQSSEKVQEMENKIDSLKKQVEHLNKENETYRNEKNANEKMLLEQLDNMRAEVKELTRLNCKLSSQTEVNEEKFKIMQNNTEIYKKQITALEKQNKIYSEAIIKHEQAATYLKDETIQAQSKLSRAEVMLGNLQKENALLRDAESRLVKDKEMVKRQTHQQNLIQSNIELIKATLERTDAEGKLRLEARLDEAHRECAALRRRLQEEQDRFRQLSEHLEKQAQTAVSRMEEEKQQADKLRQEVIETREELIKKSNQIEELTMKIKLSAFSAPETSEEGKKIRLLEQQNADYIIEIESLKTKLKTTKEAADQYFNVADAAEQQTKDMLATHEQLKEELEKQKHLVKELQEKVGELQGELSIQMDDQDMANAGVKSKSHQLEEELSTKTMDLKTAREQLEHARAENKSINEQLKAVENKYAREVMLHSADLQSLTVMKEELNAALGKVNELASGKDQAIEALKESKESWQKQEVLFQKEKEEMDSRFKDIDSQNNLLLDQIHALNTQLTILQAQSSSENANASMGDASFNRSFTEDEIKSSEQLLKIIKYLRQEKDIAVSKADIMEAEHQRLKTQFDIVNKQYEEMKHTVEGERQKSEISVVSASKHAEVLRKLETLNAITDSNRSLRQERDELLAQVGELRSRNKDLETNSSPLEDKCRELTTKADQMQNENIALRTEATRWRQRANMLIEKTNRTSPEDWKKLQSERENLAKQLTIERSTTTKLNDDINNLRQDKSKLEDQLKSLRAQNNTQSEEISKLKEDLSSLQTQMQQVTTNLDQCQQNNKKVSDEVRVLTEDTASKEAVITDLKNNLAQIRKIAKKYKIQYEEQMKEMEQLKQEKSELEGAISNGAEKQEQLIQEQRSDHEGRLSQLEQQHREAVEQLNQQIQTTNEELENVKKENENLKQLGVEKEERFKTLFKNAKDRIVHLTEQNNTLKDEINRDKPESDNAGEGSSRNSELIEKVNKLQKEKDDMAEEQQQEKEKLLTDIESLTQRVNQLQRQLGSQQGSKPSTSSSSSDKSTTEPPTANIKPMAVDLSGHSTNTQTQSVPIQPWRSGGEPPLASIRPMSAQLRTVAVLPTSQSPSAVMVPPQQQVHTTGSNTIEALSSSPTSSHTDYVPATSSASAAVHSGPRQVAVPPTQSSQDAEDDENVQMQNAPQQQAVALVLPRVEPPSSGPTQEQGTSSSSSSNTVTTTQAGLKRQRDADTDSSCQSDDQSKGQQSKRTRVQQAGTVSDSGLEVEYQVPTSSQRDHDDDNVIVVESDEEGAADEGEGADDDQDDPDTEGYDMEGMEQDNYEEADCQDVEEDEEEAGNEVEVIEDSSEVPNQSERQEINEEEIGEQAQSEAISSGTDGTGRSVPTTPLQSSPQEAVPGADDAGSHQSTHSDAELPSITVSGVDDTEHTGEGSSGDCMGPPSVAGTSSEGNQQSEQSEEMLEGDDGVSSEGEKPPATEEGEEEGREAEASPSTQSRRFQRGANSARRNTPRQSPGRGGMHRSGPTPIIWADQRSPHFRQDVQRGRPNQSPNFNRAVARRARGRMQRPYGRF
ncbi:unnamed protein product [Brassicogethes aeneus]|uniref:Nucleoprotein TPR n=1 Tax=Brassicogethes aeneus TaxID=1431903 RepID=A0A9P0ARD9_BRAAE|nr:unnamed protein product [Brassicogethes aeneus]